jgi:class 3 adenylate cyclase
MRPEIRYVRPGGVSIAYQVFGDGPDLLFVPGFVSNLEYQWEFRLTSRFFERLASFARVIELDRRGTGLSDRMSPNDLPPLEVLVQDLLAVLDAAGSKRAAVTGFLDGNFQAALFAATYPERTSALILYGSSACGLRQPDYPWAWTLEQWEEFLNDIANGWGTEAHFREMFGWSAPSVLEDEETLRQAMSFWRFAADTGAVLTLERLYMQTDIRRILPSIHVPTLVLHRTGDPTEEVEGARYLASQIPGARFMELPGADFAPWAGDQDEVLDEIEEFLTGVRRGPEPDRVLATVLFTDLVGSTEKAAQVGDRRWRELLDAHNHRVRSELIRFRGREIDTAGDSFLATFEGPARAVRCALAISEAVEGIGLQVRAGVHTGEVELMGDNIGGIAVHIGARVAALARPREVLVSSTVKDLVAGSGLDFEDRGFQPLKGVPDEWHLYAVTPNSGGSMGQGLSQSAGVWGSNLPRG